MLGGKTKYFHCCCAEK